MEEYGGQAREVLSRRSQGPVERLEGKDSERESLWEYLQSREETRSVLVGPQDRGSTNSLSLVQLLL